MGEEVSEDIFTAAVTGQPWALRMLYEELAPKVSARAGYLISHGARDPEDLASEVFLAVFTRLSTVTGAPGLHTLVFSVAHARLVDDLRRRSRQPEPMGYDPSRDTRTSRSSEDEATVSMRTQGAIQLLARLPDDQRDVLMLRTLADLTVDQDAATLGKSRGAVKQAQTTRASHAARPPRSRRRSPLNLPRGYRSETTLFHGGRGARSRPVAWNHDEDPVTGYGVRALVTLNKTMSPKPRERGTPGD